MGLLEPHAGHGGGDGEARLTTEARPTKTGRGAAVEVRSADEARIAATQAAAAGRPLVLLSPRGGAASLGPAVFAAIVEAGRERHPAATGMLDCEDAQGHALHALRVGIDAVVYTGPEAVRERLADIARATGRVVLAARPDALVLYRQKDAPEACRRWLCDPASTGPCAPDAVAKTDPLA